MKTRAALFHAAGEPMEVAEVDLEEPGPGEVLVRMTACGICGTDLHMVRGEWQRPTPMVLGHEGSGIVESVGTGVERVDPGDHVVLSWAPSCGECSDCRRGRPAACLQLQRALARGTRLDGSTGVSRNGQTVYRGTATGALAEHVVVGQKEALPIDDTVPLEQAALLGCAALTGVGAALFAAQIEPGSSVLVIGAGGVGQFLVQGARIAGAAEIVSVDPLMERLQLAVQLGATRAVQPEWLEETMREALADGADYAFDAVGDPETTTVAFRWTRNGGSCVIVGLPKAGARLELDPVDFVRRERVLTGTIYGSEDPAVSLPTLLEHLQGGRLELAALLGETYPLEQVNDAVEASLAGAPGRVLVTP